MLCWLKTTKDRLQKPVAVSRRCSQKVCKQFKLEIIRKYRPILFVPVGLNKAYNYDELDQLVPRSHNLFSITC